MLAAVIAVSFLVVAVAFAVGVPMMIFGPRVVVGRLTKRSDGRMMLGTIATTAVAIVLIPLSIDPLISAGDIAHMSAENFNRLDWKI